MKNKLIRLAAKLTTAAMVVSMFAGVTPASAAAVETVSDVMTRQKVNENSNHTIVFTLNNAIAADGSTLTLTFNAAFDLTTVIEDDVDVSGSVTGELTTAADCSAAEEMGVAVAGQVLTLTVCSGDGGNLSSAEVVTIEIGTNATASGTGANQIGNPAAVGTGYYDIVFGGTGTATGTFYITIVDDDQVTVTAQVDPSLYFDIDTATAHADSNAPYIIGLGLVTTTDTRVSGTSDGVNYIFLDYYTNAVGGMTITMKNANGTNGLVSTSVPADTIPNAAGVVSDGVARYGLCVVSATSSSGDDPDGGAYTEGTNCTADTEGNTVRVLSSGSPEAVTTATAPMTNGSTQIAVQASISSLTVAHNDYTDTLTFIATATF